MLKILLSLSCFLKISFKKITFVFSTAEQELKKTPIFAIGTIKHDLGKCKEESANNNI